MEALARLCAGMAAVSDLDGLSSLLLTRADGTYEKHEVPWIVAAALVRSGSHGVRELGRILPLAPGAIYPGAILGTLWHAGAGTPVPESWFGASDPLSDLPDEVRRVARIVVDDIIAESQTDVWLLDVVIGVQQRERHQALSESDGKPSAFSRHVVRVWGDSSILLTERLIDEFSALVALAADESAYQGFLEEHPVFLDPLAAEVLNRKRLGLEFVTDFVVRRHDNRYVVVEIEKPQDRLFTARGDFTAGFTHAVGQVLDFQGWIASNVAYARTHLPFVEDPAGLVIMGARAELNDDRKTKLRRWTTNSRHIELLTYDDLVNRARSLHASLRRRA